MAWSYITTSLAALLLIASVLPAPVPPDTETVEVAKYDGSIQCKEGSGIALSEMQLTLSNEGIEVFSSRRSHDCLLRTQVCGQSTGFINVYRIKSEQLMAAMSLGFTPFSDCQNNTGN